MSTSNTHGFLKSLQLKCQKGSFSYLTLELTDPNLQQKFNHRRSQILNSLFLPYLVLLACYLVNILFIFRNNLSAVKYLL